MEAIELITKLAEYVEEVTKLTARPYLRASQYRLLYLTETDVTGRLGIDLDVNEEESVWLKIDRMVSKPPPKPADELAPWLTVPSDPKKKPKTKEFIAVQVPKEEAAEWVAAGKVVPDDVIENQSKDNQAEPENNENTMVDVILRLEKFSETAAEIEKYIDDEWTRWSTEEIPRRETINIYQKLFSLQQSIDTGSLDKPLEIIWGVGVSRWQHETKGIIDHALLEIPVEIVISPVTASVSIFCLDKSPKIAEGLIRSLDSDGATNFSNFSRDFIERTFAQGDLISPFKKETFETLLRNAATQIDQDGEYWADQSEDVDDRTVPNARSNLIVTDTWAIYARPRSENFIIEDVRKQREALEEIDSSGEELPGVAGAIVGAKRKTENGPPPGPTNGPPRPPTPGNQPVPIYLPKASNQDQRDILRKLERMTTDGVVVQGPPGTGKTHTIANLICHYMATGRRVLVSSHSEGALAVLREQIPESIRNLTVSLLTNERQGTEQLESAVKAIQRATSTNRPSDLAVEIQAETQKSIQARQKIAAIDNQIKTIAKAHLEEFGGKPNRTLEWANWIIDGQQEHRWLEDRIGPTQKPEFGDEHIQRARTARQTLGPDLTLVSAKLPDPNDLPDPTTVASVHNDILVCERLSGRIRGGDIPALAGQLREPEQRLRACRRALEALLAAFDEIETVGWLQGYLERGCSASQASELDTHLESLFDQISNLADRRSANLSVAIFVPDEIFDFGAVSDVLGALSKTKEGKTPFPFWAGKGRIKELFNEIKIDGQEPDFSKPETSDQIEFYINWRNDLTKFVARWNARSADFDLPVLGESGENLGRWLTGTNASVQKLRGVRSHSIPTLRSELPSLFPMGLPVDDALRSKVSAQNALEVVSEHLGYFRLQEAFETLSSIRSTLDKASGEIVNHMNEFVSSEIANPEVRPIDISNGWGDLLRKLSHQIDLEPYVREVVTVSELIKRSGALRWSERIKTEIVDGDNDPWTPISWRRSWVWRQLDTHILNINQKSRIHALAEQRQSLERGLARSTEREVELRTTLELCKRLDSSMQSALQTVVTLLNQIGAGTGQQARHLRRDAQKAMEKCYAAIPCWIMPSWRVSEMLPAVPGSFDLVIIDEASQSDIRELPVLTRGKKVLIVGDDKQVSPTAIGIRINTIQILFNNYLREQPFGPIMRPGFSLYDLFLAIFAGQKIMLREHFRCVEPIIRYSFQFYDEEIQPLRIPKKSERLDPPLVDVYLKYGHKERDKTNPAEASFVVDEISKIVGSPTYDGRTIGVVSLLGSHQAALIEKLLLSEIGEDKYLEHEIVCGDAATFQGKERDIMFVSMVAAPNDFRKVTAKLYRQRFNVALSRAKDRMYLVRSVDVDELQPSDLKAGVIQHFANPMGEIPSTDQNPIELCESDFEKDFYKRVSEKGYRVRPQVRAGDFRIDFVIEGNGDQRLAIELDGDKWHGPDRWWSDYTRQLALERMGWIFWRCWGSDWALNSNECLSDLLSVLEDMGIHPIAGEVTPYQYTDHRVIEFPPEDEFADIDFETNEPKSAVGDTVEVEFTDREPPERFTYVISADKDDPKMGIVLADGEIGQCLIKLAVGDDALLPIDDGENAVVVGIVKGSAGNGGTGEQPELNPDPPEHRPTVN